MEHRYWMPRSQHTETSEVVSCRFAGMERGVPCFSRRSHGAVWWVDIWPSCRRREILHTNVEQIGIPFCSFLLLFQKLHVESRRK